jgi:hypothetical protein
MLIAPAVEGRAVKRENEGRERENEENIVFDYSRLLRWVR